MSSFQERQKSLFNELKNAEEQCSFSKSNETTPQQDYGRIDKHTYRRLKHEMKQFRGKESIYKRQDANIRECLRAKTIPGYMKNPQKWVYYSLSDVTPDQMSDSTNTTTALAFIRELEEKEEATILKMNEEPDDAVFKKPSFHYSSSIKKVPIDEKVVFKSNKIVMPEYVVGVTKKKEKKNTVTREPAKDNHESAKRAELKLDHLYEED